MNTNHQWSYEAERTLEKLAAEGLSNAVIGKRLGKSAKSVQSRRVKLGIDQPQERTPAQKESRLWTEADDNALRAHFKDGLTNKVIASRMNRTEASVNWRRVKLKLRYPMSKFAGNRRA